MSLERIRDLIVDAQIRLRTVHHTNGARRSLADAIRELDGIEAPQDLAARYQAQLRRDADRIRPRPLRSDETETLL